MEAGEVAGKAVPVCVSASVSARLDAVVPLLDQLVDGSRAIRDAHHFDRLEEQGELICRLIHGAFRNRG